MVFGPKDSPFEDGIFHLNIEFSEDYPYVPPVARFTSNIFHPNVYDENYGIDENPEMPGTVPFGMRWDVIVNKGDIQLELLQKKWSPANNVGDILKSVRGLLQRYLLVPLNLFKTLMFFTFLCLKKSNFSQKSQIRLTEMSRLPDLVTPF